MAQPDLQSAIDRLYGVPMEDFVGERARLAKELKGGGDKEAADEVAKLPKPTAAAWALNHVAREDPEAVADWLDAADELRDASLNASKVGGDTLRTAMAAHRAATTELTGVVRDRAQPGGRPLSGAMVERVRALLQSATADPDEAERLRAGRITEDTSPVPAPPARPASARRTAAKRAPRAAEPGRTAKARAERRVTERDRRAEARAARRAELERLVSAAEREAARLRSESDRRTGAADSAAERLEEARRALNRSESEGGAAREAAKDAEKAAASAEQDLRRLRARLRDA